MKAPKRTKRCQDCKRPFKAGPYARWGLCCRWRHRWQKPKKYIHSEQSDAVIRARYDSRVRGRAAEIARGLGWPAFVVKRRAGELGLAQPRHAWKGWTPDEVLFLEEHAGVKHVHWIATKLRRSLTSVILKLKRMHISRRIREGYTLRELELCLGADHRVIERWIREGKLRATHESQHHRDPWRFTDKDVLAFVRENPNAFRLDRVDQLWFLDLVFGGRVGDTAVAAA